MRTVSAEQIESVGFADLIEALRLAFTGTFDAPERWAIDYSDSSGDKNTLLLMPASDGSAVGVKLLTLTPGNKRCGKPFIQGHYLLFDATDGRPLALIEARALTNMRTAATSALASSFLSRPDSRCLLVVGTGALAPYLARAHAAVRPIETILIWGRDSKKAERLAVELHAYGARAVVDLGEAVSADIVSCATSAEYALLKPSHLRAGQHIDLVGAFKPTMQELHEDGVAMTRIFVDTRQGALSEAGDILIALRKGVIEESDILGELSDLASGRHPGRQSKEEITLFKSVGHAIEDLVAARLVLEQFDGE